MPRGENDRLPPRTLVMDVTMTHNRCGHTTQRTGYVQRPNRHSYRNSLPMSELNPWKTGPTGLPELDILMHLRRKMPTDDWG